MQKQDKKQTKYISESEFRELPLKLRLGNAFIAMRPMLIIAIIFILIVVWKKSS